MARRVAGEIVTVDSMQVYRGMDVGTAKPSVAQMGAIPHHMIDIADPASAFSVAAFQAAGRVVLRQLSAAGSRAIICGGSGLHFRALVDPFEFPPTNPALRAKLDAVAAADLAAELSAADPDVADHIDMANTRRLVRAVEVYRLTGQTPSDRHSGSAAAAVREYRSVVDFVAVGLDSGDQLEDRIADRFEGMVDGGWVEEAGRLSEKLGPTARLAIGYRELMDVAAGWRTLRDVKPEVIQSTISFAKRQRTYFRRDPRIHWIPWHDDPAERAADAVAIFEEAGAWSS